MPSQSQLHGVDVWARPFAEIKGSLIGASQVCSEAASFLPLVHFHIPSGLISVVFGQIWTQQT